MEFQRFQLGREMDSVLDFTAQIESMLGMGTCFLYALYEQE